MNSETDISVELYDLGRQEVTIRVQGVDVLLFKDSVDVSVEDPEELMPDIVRLFAWCVGVGMFSGASHEPSASRAELKERHFDSESRRLTWRVELEGIDRGAFRVLLNMLRARDLDSVEVRTVGSSAADTGPPPRLDHRALRYPGLPEPLPFSLEVELPEKSAAPHRLQIVFVDQPDQETVDEACTVLDKWTALLLLGGYPPENVDPRDSGVIPDLACQFDAFSVGQSFDAFLCDEASFNLIVSWAKRLHRTSAIDKVCVD